MFKDTQNGLILQIRISPNSSKNEIITTDEIIKIKVTAQPIENKANKALIEFLSKQFKVPKSSIEIIKGETSKDKTILIKVFDEEKLQNIKNLLTN